MVIETGECRGENERKIERERERVKKQQQRLQLDRWSSCCTEPESGALAIRHLSPIYLYIYFVVFDWRVSVGVFCVLLFVSIMCGYVPGRKDIYI